MKIVRLRRNAFGENGYLLTADGKNAVAIDPGEEHAAQDAKNARLNVRYVLLTHGHGDHICGCGALQEAGAEVGCHVDEVRILCGRGNVAELLGVRVPPFTVDFTFRDGEKLFLCGMEIEVLATPGHTAGSCCFKAGSALFTGDTLFCGTAGRSDLPSGDGNALEKSLARIAALEGDWEVYPGHGCATTLDEERRRNPYLL